MEYDLTYIQENCAGCQCCQLACSRAYAKSFRPSAARITIDTRGSEYRYRLPMRASHAVFARIIACSARS